MGRKSASGSGIRDEQPGSYFLEPRTHFFGFLGLKYLNSLMRIRDPGWRQFGSGIRDKHPGSATLHFLLTFLCHRVRFRQKAWDEADFAHEEEDDNDPDGGRDVDSDPDGGVHMHRGNGSQPASSQPSCDTVSPETRFSLPLRYVQLVTCDALLWKNF
jgi:hypothetical protein